MSSKNSSKSNTTSNTIRKQLKRSKGVTKNNQKKEPKLAVIDFNTMTIKPK